MLSRANQTEATDNLKNPAIVVFFFLTVCYITINLIYFETSDPASIFINTILNPPLAAIGVILAFYLARQAQPSHRSRMLWIGLVIGWICWTVAETLWTYAFITGLEFPYPGWADLFWCVGYFPMYLALGIRGRMIIEKPSRLNQAIVMVISILIFGFTFYGVLLPILRAYDSSAVLESLLSLFYPLADTFLVIQALRILFPAHKGTFAYSWFWIALGFILSAFSDLFFSYASGLELYYPDMQVNLISVFLVDVPYTLSYLFFIVGLIPLCQKKLEPGQPDRMQGRSAPGRVAG